MLIYIAGKYSDPSPIQVRKNVMNAANIAIWIIKHRGHDVFVPHTHSGMLHDLSIKLGDEIPYERWLELDRSILRHCDAFLLLSHSNGADKELELAKVLGLPIYHNARDIPMKEEAEDGQI